jgi:hypothetical protein
MTQAERKKMLNDKWPAFTKKNREDFLEVLKEAPKAKIFDVDECNCDRNKRPF